LHRDGRCTLAAGFRELRQCGAQHALVVDATMLVETCVLDRENGILHHLRDLLDRREVAPLVAEFADQHAVGREHAHRQLGPVVGQAAGFRQVRVGHRQRHRDQQQQRQGTGRHQSDKTRDPLAQPDQPLRQGGCAAACGGIGGAAGSALGFAHGTPTLVRAIIGSGRSVSPTALKSTSRCADKVWSARLTGRFDAPHGV